MQYTVNKWGIVEFPRPRNSSSSSGNSETKRGEVKENAEQQQRKSR